MKRTLIAMLTLAATGAALAQATVKDDGQWRAALGAAFSSASGNTKSTSFSVLADAVRATPQDKWSLYGNALYGSSGGTKTADLMRLGTKYDWNFRPQWYAFGMGEFERDQIARLDSRLTVGGGVGWRIVTSPALNFEIFGGGAYVSDRYDGARLIDGSLRDSYSYPSLLLGEESTHKLGESTTAKQRLVLYPNLKNTGEYRAQWDAGLSVAISSTMNLTAGLAVRVNSDPGVGVKKTDTLFTTGISVKFD
jgi:putative salt-induced outer membrane protein YdiY